MIKQDSSGKYYSSLDPSKTFSTSHAAGTHDEVLRLAREATRPDSRTDLQRIESAAFRVPMSTQPEKYAALEASLRKRHDDPAFRPGISPTESLLHSIKALRHRDAEAEDRAADEAAWLAKPLIAGGLIEAKRLLQEYEEDHTVDRASVVAVSQLIQALSTPGASETWIRSQLRSLLDAEDAQKLARRVAANDELAAAQAKVAALAVAQTVNIKVPVEGSCLISRGNSYTANLMSAGAPPEQLAAAFSAMDAAFSGDTAALEATLAANEGSQT